MAEQTAARYFVRKDVVDHDVTRFRVIDQQTGDVMSGWWDYDRALAEADILNREPTVHLPDLQGRWTAPTREVRRVRSLLPAPSDTQLQGRTRRAGSLRRGD